MSAPPPPVPLVETGPFFRAVDWSAFWTAFLVAFAVYVYTLAPTVTLEDSGELAVGSTYLGVPHPPGYPIWTILTWLFTRLFWFVRFRGHPNPAWSVGLASAFFGAFASGLTAVLICRSGRDMLRTIRATTEAIGEAGESAICWASGIAASLVFAFSPVNWSQSVIVEVYSLNAFFLVLVLFFLYVWMRRPTERLPWLSAFVLGIGLLCLVVMLGLLVWHLRHYHDFFQVGIHYLVGMLAIVLMGIMAALAWRRHPDERLLYLVGLTFGLGLTNYQVLLLMLASLAVVVLVRDLALFRDFFLAGLPYALGLALVKLGAIPGIIHPTHPLTYAYAVLNFVVLALVYAYLPNGRRVAPTILFLELGLLVYVFMPLSSERNPPINWGYPRTWEGFVHAITRGQYERIVPTNIFSIQFVRQVGDYMTDLRNKFTLPIAILGILPFAGWNVLMNGRRVRALYAAIPLAILAVALIMTEEVLVPTGTEIPALSATYRVLIFVLGVLMAIGGIALMIGEVEDLLASAAGRTTRVFTERLMAGLALLGLAVLVLAGVVMLLKAILDPSLDLGLREKASLASLLIVPAGIVALVAYMMHSRGRLELDIGRMEQKWVLGTLSGFLVMSVVLIALANPKGDIQDEFIQRVKFISSHALFAFWIGYGLLMGLSVVDTVARGNRAVKWAGLGAALLIPLIPIHENAYNQELLRTDGGAEQNGHDFGWQFGNYQLRGAAAILEELDPEEEPLPNPRFPPEMGPRAVFYGGTDPGRFVPTYMIFCPKVRPDVYLITQNALADNTYMSVMRDLYGDEIWIPSVVDGNSAFQRYVDDVRAGRIPASADIKIDGGRVSVQGVGGVMLINGILAQMIFDHNKALHDFYVEESYVINWMYPFLTPHGLIMKINRDMLPNLPPEVVRDDLDFWDWYSRRLLANGKFLRDVVARKSFSKLRSAIAGVYRVRGLFPESERAFLEALRLYPLSPEANFRLADLYLAWNRPADAIRVMEEFCRQDPRNDRARGFLEEMKQRTEAQRREADLRRELEPRRRALETELGSGTGSVPKALELADIYRKLGMTEPFLALIRSLIEQKGLPPVAYLRLAQLSGEEKRIELVEQAMQQYTEAAPADMRGWLDLAAVRLVMQRTEPALQAARQAVKVGGEAARAVLREDARFAPLRGHYAFRALLGEG